ncbi:hypothetical protein RB623_26680 [Mesorhizobium sp. LHD-90]|uniref:hypothetical protein n=1 Tax=Mesorhizobium sp. LHD-90 TaxID=3071414 RepID=UPI0027DF7C7E|nr:hypothetical protein [Mesorhizobium sp. LHD-90]MDQ6437652.1 hypothetical protein [Mesorhizobium sp. LHD-90]
MARKAKRRTPANRRTLGRGPLGIDPAILEQLLVALRSDDTQGASLAEELDSYIADLLDEDAGESDAEATFSRAADMQNRLNDIRIAANGGDREAHRELEEGLAVVDAAAQTGDLPGHAVMLLFQMFGEAEIDPGDALREVILANIHSARSPDSAVEMRLSDAVASLAELDEQVAQSSFAAMIRYMPSAARYEFVHALGGHAQETARAVLLGCLLDADSELVRIAANGLIASACNAPVPNRLVERLVLIRGLVPAPMHPTVDATIAALRSRALPPVAREPLELVKCIASVCDGAGAQSLIALMRRGKTHVLATFLVKTDSGLADAMVLNDFSKRDFDAMTKAMGLTLVPVSPALIQRRLAIALAISHSKGTTATFGFVEALEALGIAALRPEAIEPESLLDELLADTPPLVPLTLAEAAGRLDDDDLTGTWFEAGPASDGRLDGLRGAKQRQKAALAYIEERRVYWAAQCANSALILRDSGKPLGPLWQHFAVIGQHFAGSEPVANNLLAQVMAQRTADAHESQRFAGFPPASRSYSR